MDFGNLMDFDNLIATVRGVGHPFTKPDPMPYEQAPNSVPHLFCAQKRYTTAEWFTALSSSPSVYDTCEVVSVTWVKALVSPVSHEFIQFIVEDTRNNTRARVYTDRQTDGDFVIVGWNFSSKKNPSDQDDLPLPLWSLDMPKTRPKVIKMAEILHATTQIAPTYNLLSEMCFWYAQSVFLAARLDFKAKEKDWGFSRCRYNLILFTRASQRSEAESFRHQNIADMSYQISNDVPAPITTAEYLKPIVNQLRSDEEAQGRYQEALQLDATEKLDVASLSQALDDLQKRKDPSAEKSLEDFKLAGNQFADAMLSDPENEANMEAFEEAWEKNYCAENHIDYPPVDDHGERIKIMRQKQVYVGPNVEERERFDTAMEALVGAILREVKSL